MKGALVFLRLYALLRHETKQKLKELSFLSTPPQFPGHSESFEMFRSVLLDLQESFRVLI